MDNEYNPIRYVLGGLDNLYHQKGLMLNLNEETVCKEEHEENLKVDTLENKIEAKTV